MGTLIDTRNIIDEVVNYLRNELTDPESRGSDITENFTATSGQTDFSLSNNPVFNIKSVEVDGNSKDFGKDYTISFTQSSCTLSLNSSLSGGESVDIEYHYDDTWVYKTTPRLDLNIESYPRVSVTEIATTDEIQGIGLEGLSTDITFRVMVAFEYRGDSKDMLKDIKQAMWDNKKGWYYITGCYPIGSAGPGLDPARDEEVFLGDMDFLAPLQLQT